MSESKITHIHVCECGWTGSHPPPAEEHVGHEITATPATESPAIKALFDLMDALGVEQPPEEAA